MQLYPSISYEVALSGPVHKTDAVLVIIIIYMNRHFYVPSPSSVNTSSQSIGHAFSNIFFFDEIDLRKSSLSVF